ncbi:hypothetical protein HK101_010025, partial [Irineochytrium annulatum]
MAFTTSSTLLSETIRTTLKTFPAPASFPAPTSLIPPANTGKQFNNVTSAPCMSFSVPSVPGIANADSKVAETEVYRCPNTLAGSHSCLLHDHRLHFPPRISDRCHESDAITNSSTTTPSRLAHAHHNVTLHPAAHPPAASDDDKGRLRIPFAASRFPAMAAHHHAGSLLMPHSALTRLHASPSGADVMSTASKLAHSARSMRVADGFTRVAERWRRKFG